MTKEDHKAFVEQLSNLQDQKKKIAEKIVKGLDFRVVVAGSIEARNNQRRKTLSLLMKEPDQLFTQVSLLGKKFAKVKLGS